MLEGKVLVVTGGGSGIGRATAEKFAHEGAKIIVADVNETGGRETVDLIRKAGGTAHFITTDVGSFPAVEAAVQKAVDEFGRIDVMFNNAGIGRYKPLLEMDPEDYDVVIKVDQYGVFYGILAAGRKMKELGIHGTIINTTSVFAFLGSHGVIGYHAAKGAVKMMTQAAAIELAPYDIRVIAVAPGTVDTPIIQGYKDQGLTEHLKQLQMRQKLQTPEEIANVVALLATDGARAINGSVVMVDDGFAEFKE
jgi:NAD(P)-dependent dehydrogenase (short-subunit alcohol dehydrogenase family)